MGDVSIWVTIMLRAGDMSATDTDIRSLQFPRVGIPDEPDWVPRGLSWRSLRHPLGNGSRHDVLTFLHLRQPVWASDELLSFVVRTVDPPVPPADEASAVQELVAVQQRLLRDLQAWWGASRPETGDRRP